MKFNVTHRKTYFLFILFLFLFSFSVSGIAYNYYNYSDYYSNSSWNNTHLYRFYQYNGSSMFGRDTTRGSYGPSGYYGTRFVHNDTIDTEYSVILTLNESIYSIDRMYIYLEDSIQAKPNNVSVINLENNELIGYWINPDPSQAGCCGDAVLYPLRNESNYYYSNGFKDIKFIFQPTGVADKTTAIYEVRFNVSNEVNYNPYFNVTPDNIYKCITFNDTFPVSIGLNWSVLDIEGDTIQYAYLSPLGYSDFYKDYSKKGFLSYMSYKMDTESLNDDLVYNPDTSLYCNYCSDFYCNVSFGQLGSYIVLENDYTDFTSGFNAFGLQLKENCVGYKLYTTKTKYLYRDFFYNTTLYGLKNGENYTIEFLDQNLEKVVDFLVKAEGGNLSLSTSDGSSYIEVYDETLDYNMTSFKLDYLANGTLTFGGNNDVYSILSNNPSSTNVVKSLDSNDFISYVRINYTDVDYMIQSMYAYNGESQVLDWTSTQPKSVEVYTPGVHEFDFYVKDDKHTEYNISEFSIKVEQKKYCWSGNKDYPVIDYLLGDPLKNFFRSIATEEEIEKAFYFLFFVFIIIFMFTSYSLSKEVRLFEPVMFSSLICFGLAILIAHKTMITFLITFTISIILLGIKK